MAALFDAAVSDFRPAPQPVSWMSRPRRCRRRPAGLSRAVRFRPLIWLAWRERNPALRALAAPE